MIISEHQLIGILLSLERPAVHTCGNDAIIVYDWFDVLTEYE